MSNYANYHCFGFDPTKRSSSEVITDKLGARGEDCLSSMFTVKSKRTGIKYDVYAVNCGTNSFLVYFNDRFSWFPVSYFRPVETTEGEKKLNSNKGHSNIFKSSSYKESTP